MKRLITIALVAVLVLAACGDDDAGTTTTPTTTTPTTTTTIVLPDSVIAEFRTPDGETFKVSLAGAAADHVRQGFASGDPAGIPNGLILRGDGGVNTGHNWHLENVEFADMAIEVCDGTVSHIDDVGYDAWVASQGDRYCPWSAELIAVTEG